MQLLVIRHAIAETRATFAAAGERRDDALRPLTQEGRERMRAAAKGLRRVVASIDVLAASPLVRAQQTAAIIAADYEPRPVVTTPALEPDAEPEALLAFLGSPKVKRAEVVAVVGHEPHLGMLITWLLMGIAESRVPLKKGGACLLQLARRPAPGDAALQWALTPSLLRRLGGAR